MDIATRLKVFMDSVGETSTTFADKCRIPRPSFSQLLGGRNKKVSDEVIAKIHVAFPRLSVLWLMFGEGDMEINANTQISEPENGAEIGDNSSYAVDGQGNDDAIEQHISDRVSESEKFEKLNSSEFSDLRPTPVATVHVAGIKDCDEGRSKDTTSLQMEVDKARRVVNIMVFYSDKSFETFVPQR